MQEDKRRQLVEASRLTHGINWTLVALEHTAGDYGATLVIRSDIEDQEDIGERIGADLSTIAHILQEESWHRADQKEKE